LGVEIFFREDGKVALGTVQFLTAMVKEFEEETGIKLNKTYTTPTAPWLFKIKKNAKTSVPLCEKFTSFFRKYTMKHFGHLREVDLISNQLWASSPREGRLAQISTNDDVY